MTYRGHIEGDKIVLDEDVKLPDGATVTIVLESTDLLEDIHPEIRPWYGILKLPDEVDPILEYKESRLKKHLK